MEARDIALMKSIAAGAVPEAVHINLDDYVENYFENVYSQILRGNTEFTLPVLNSVELWESINDADGDLWLDVCVFGDKIYSSRAAGILRDQSGRIVWVDIKFAARSGEWFAMYVGLEGNILSVKVTDYAQFI